jgi:DNA mismatch repair protein MutS
VIIEKAKTKLKYLEDQAYSEQQAAKGVNQLDLFLSNESHPVITLLEEIKPDDLSPREALELLYTLKVMAG